MFTLGWMNASPMKMIVEDNICHLITSLSHRLYLICDCTNGKKPLAELRGRTDVMWNRLAEDDAAGPAGSEIEGGRSAFSK